VCDGSIVEDGSSHNHLDHHIHNASIWKEKKEKNKEKRRKTNSHSLSNIKGGDFSVE
jgi:hypothetical protein